MRWDGGDQDGEGAQKERERDLSSFSYKATNPIGLGPHPSDLI